MITYIASDEKYKGKIQEDLLIQQYLLSMERKCEILTLDEIVNSVCEGDSVILKSIWGYHIDYKGFLKKCQMDFLYLEFTLRQSEYEHTIGNGIAKSHPILKPS